MQAEQTWTPSGNWRVAEWMGWSVELLFASDSYLSGQFTLKAPDGVVRGIAKTELSARNDAPNFSTDSAASDAMMGKVRELPIVFGIKMDYTRGVFRRADPAKVEYTILADGIGEVRADGDTEKLARYFAVLQLIDSIKQEGTDA